MDDLEMMDIPVSRDGRTVSLPARGRIGSLPREGNRVHTAEEVILFCFGSSWREEVRKYVSLRGAELCREVPGLEGAGNPELCGCILEKTQCPVIRPGMKNIVDFLVLAKLSAWKEAAEEDQAPARAAFSVKAADRLRYGDRLYIRRTGSLRLRLRYLLDLKPCSPRCAGPVIGPEGAGLVDPDLLCRETWRDPWLLPVMEEKDYIYQGRLALARCFPEAFSEGAAAAGFRVEPEEMARRLGLKIREVRFADRNLLGTLYFQSAPVCLIGPDGRPQTERIPACTILLSEDGHLSPEDRRQTLMHEISHFLLDLPFYLLQQISDPAFVCLAARKKKEDASREELVRMEAQAEKLPAYILMEEESLRRFAEETLASAAELPAERRARHLLDSSAERFGVSREAAAYRLAGMGYGGVQGLDQVYTDAAGTHTAPDHVCAGPWPRGLTYTVSAEELAAMSLEDELLDRLLRTGQYRYVEGHLILNASRWVGKSRREGLHLKKSARRAMDRCCAAFRKLPEAREEQAWLMSLAARHEKTPVRDRYRSHYRLDSLPGDRDYRKENDDLVQDALRWGELLQDLPDELGPAVAEILDRKGLTREWVAGEMDISPRMLYKITAKGADPADGHLIALCVAMRLPYDVSMALLDRTRFKWRKIPIHYLYRRFLLEAENLTVERCEDILRDHGFQPFFAAHAS